MPSVGNENPSTRDENFGPLLTVAIVNHEIYSYDDIDLLERTVSDATQLAGPSGEIVLIETSDEDGETMVDTIDGCEVRILGFSTISDLSAAHNFGLREARGRWILWLTPGDRIDEHERAAIRKLIADADPTTVYRLMIRARQGEIVEQAVKTRLMPNDSRIRFSGQIKPTVDPSIESSGIPYEVHEATIDAHVPCDMEILRRRGEQMAEFLEPFATRRRSLRAEYWLALGDAEMDRRRWAHAAEAYQRATETTIRQSPERLEAFYGLWAACSLDKGLRTTLVNVGLTALDNFPLDAQMQILMGGEMRRQGRIDLAIRAFEIAAMYGELELRTWHTTDISERAVFCLATTLQMQGEEAQAEKVLVESLKQIKSARLQRILLDIFTRNDKLPEAIRLIGKMSDDPVERINLEETVQGACLAAEQKWADALRHLQSAYGAGYRDPILLRWLTAALAASGDMDLAERIARQWHKAEPDSTEVQVYLGAFSDRSTLQEVSDQSEAAKHRLDTADATTDRPPVAPPTAPPIMPGADAMFGAGGTLESVD